MGMEKHITICLLPAEVNEESDFRPTRRHGVQALACWRACTLADLTAS